MLNSSKKAEKICEHDCNLTVNEQTIIKVTITDHYQQKPGREKITHKIIISLIKTLDGREIEPEPKKKPTWPDVFVRNRILYQGKKYRLVFWFKNNTDNHLWIRTCHYQN